MVVAALALLPAQTKLDGPWQGWAVLEGLPPTKLDWTFTFNPDGTFTERMRNKVMMDLEVDATGIFTFDGEAATLKGTATYRMDDGYKKSSGKRAMGYRFLLRNDELVQKGEEGLVFRRIDAGPPALREKPKPLPSAPEAVRILKEVERRYAAFKSYADEVRVKTNGDGFMPPEARITTRYVRPKRLFQKVVSMEGGKAYKWDAAWTDGKASWLSWDDVGYRHTRPNPISHGLMMLKVDAAGMAPKLLMPETFGRNPLSGMAQILLKPEEKVGGKSCFVVALSHERAPLLTLWIEQGTYLVLRSHSVSADAVTVFNPRPNVPIKASELTLATVSRS